MLHVSRATTPELKNNAAVEKSGTARVSRLRSPSTRVAEAATTLLTGPDMAMSQVK